MGRKPNPIMAEFFSRGSKITDASNRYEQTCKRCNVHFTRGRSEAMVAHLTKRCPGVTRAERAKIIFRFHDIALDTIYPYVDPDYEEKVGENSGSISTHGSEQKDGVVATNSASHNFVGLNVLAEASRRVDRKLRGLRDDINDANSPRSNQVLVRSSPSLDLALDPQLRLNSSPAQAHSVSGSSLPSSSLPSIFDLATASSSQGVSTQSSFDSNASSNLHNIAASAQATLDDTAGEVDVQMVDAHNVPGLSLYEQRIQHLIQQPMGSTATMLPSLDAQVDVFNTPPANQEYCYPNPFLQSLEKAKGPEASRLHLQPLPMDPMYMAVTVADTASSHPGAPPKARGKFEPERREEVRAVRKLGACLRCRMLKKTCSQETPCNTCKSVDDPRVWKTACVRTKLEEEFPLYNVLLCTVIVNGELGDCNGLDHRVAWSHLKGTLAAYYHEDNKLFLEGRHGRLYFHPAGADINDPSAMVESPIIIADTEFDEGLLSKTERFLKALYPVLVAHESNVPIKAALETAESLIDRAETDKLLPDVMELWAATFLITDRATHAVFEVDTSSPQDDPVILTDGPSTHMLQLQLRSLIEKRAAVNCQTILHRLEQRVLVRRGKRFEIFLIGFIFLHCAERMKWMFQSWLQPDVQFPLDAGPFHYLTKAETFAQNVCMLFSIRQLSPALVVDKATGAVVAGNVKNEKDKEDLNAWLENARLTGDPSVDFGAGKFDLHDCRSLDGTFSSRLLQL